MSDRRARAERLHDFFDLQLRFAELLAARTGSPLRQAVIKFTNLHRRFGFGDPDRAVSPRWEDYVRPLELMQRHADRVDWTQAFFETAPEEPLPSHQRFFG